MAAEAGLTGDPSLQPVMLLLQRRSHTAAERVLRARTAQLQRWNGRLNAEISRIDDPLLQLHADARSRILRLASNADGGRVQRAMVRVARTIADLAGRTQVDESDVVTAYDLCRTSPGGDKRA